MKEKYKILQTNCISDIEQDVNTAIDEGYQPCGGVAIAVGDSVLAVYLQAMVLMEKDDAH